MNTLKPSKIFQECFPILTYRMQYLMKVIHHNKAKVQNHQTFTGSFRKFKETKDNAICSANGAIININSSSELYCSLWILPILR